MHETRQVILQVVGDLREMIAAVIEAALECNLRVDYVRSGKDTCESESFFVAASSENDDSPQTAEPLLSVLRERLSPHAVNVVAERDWLVPAK